MPDKQHGGPAFLLALTFILTAALTSSWSYLAADDFPTGPDWPTFTPLTWEELGPTGRDAPSLPPHLSPFPSSESPDLEGPVAGSMHSPSLLAVLAGGSDESTLALQRKHKANSESAGFWGSLSASTEVNDTRGNTWDDPAWKRTWKTDESWKYSLGKLSLFGQVGATGDETNQQMTQVTGRTGLTCKVPMGLLGEYTLRSGPGISCTDPLRPLLMHQRADWLVEVQARLPLLFGIGLELQSSAVPPLSPLEQNRINQDLHLAFPLDEGNKINVGAKRQLSGMTDPRSWTDTTQLYMGLELSH